MGTMRLSSEYDLAEAKGFRKKISSLSYKHLYPKILAQVYPNLRKNPYSGPHIKKLKAPFKDVYRYRIGDYRLFYTIKDDVVIVIVFDIAHRKDAYR